MKKILCVILLQVSIFSLSTAMGAPNNYYQSQVLMGPVFSIGGTQNNYKSPGQNIDPYINPHSLLLGGQRIEAADGGPETPASKLAAYGSNSSIILRGHPDGLMDLGCLTCTVMTNNSVFNSRAALTGNLTAIENIANDPSFDTVLHYDETSNVEPILTLKGVTYDANHIFLPLGSYLTPEQMARIHPNQYITTNSISLDVKQKDIRTHDNGLFDHTSAQSLNPHNYYVSTVKSVAEDGSSIVVNGWGIQGGNETGHSWMKGDVPTSVYDTVRSNFKEAVAMIGSPTQTGGRNLYVTYDPIARPDSSIDYVNGDEFNMHYNGGQSNEATMRGIVIAFDCGGAAFDGKGKCYHPTYDSVGLLINGNNLPNGIINTIPSWGNEYKGWNFYIPGSAAPERSGGRHTSFESFTPTLDANNQLITRSWVQRNDTNISEKETWKNYQVDLGLVVNGTRWNSEANSGVQMGYISFNYSLDNVGGVCLIGNNTTSSDTNVPGLCIRANGEVYSASTFHLANNSIIMGHSERGNNKIGAILQPNTDGDWYVGTQVAGGANIRGINGIYAKNINAPISKITYLQDVALIRAQTTTQTFNMIKASVHFPSDHVFCGDCLNKGQAVGQGTGRWIFMDTAKTWRSDDGAIAVN
ncbi:hypothetical protein [Commensalibacter oyaizuii]|uniref:Uncharacterized protein n=1 Tax=Commensalibacter oyaizuii TaxID=3043873 RepID=A0ABT6Q022_9PROT|nr:hypothetical protein [Commensalibacter sp. TBRC 16381]MDI2090467.1 hypothetical protein [Commensalibacter sp. TBRC 16381]